MSNQHSKCDDCYKTHLPEFHDTTVLPSEAFDDGYVPVFKQDSQDELSSIKGAIGWANPQQRIDAVKRLIDGTEMNAYKRGFKEAEALTQKAVTEARKKEHGRAVHKWSKLSDKAYGEWLTEHSAELNEQNERKQ